MKAVFRTIAVITLAGSLAACGGANIEELDGWMADVRNQDHGPIDPLPTIKPYVPFPYNVAANRAPFDVPAQSDSADVLGRGEVSPPDPNRVREPLESFNIETLRFVGVWTQDGALWALVDDGNIVHRVREGNYIGRNDGRIVEATPEYLSVIEKVTSGTGTWLERPRTMKLQGNN